MYIINAPMNGIGLPFGVTSIIVITHTQLLLLLVAPIEGWRLAGGAI
jgi:hypothetical protein